MPQPTASPRVLVIGAGIGGLAAAVALQRVGIEAEVYERAEVLRPAGSGLSVMTNAVLALRALDIDLGLEKRGQTVLRSDLLDARGRLLRSLPFRAACERIGAPSVALYRGDLQAALLDAWGEGRVTLGAVATGYEVTGTGVRVRFQDGREAVGDVLVGADGINSVVRSARAGTEAPRDSEFICWLSVTPFRHPKLTTGFNAHYWGRGRRFGLHDVGHGRAYWWGTQNMSADSARHWEGDKEQIVRAFAGWADEVQEVIRATRAEDILGVPARDRPFLEQWGDGPVTLLGDAAHPMMPSLAQGGSSAIEDAVVLAQCLKAYPEPVAALRAYESLRRERTYRLVKASRQFTTVEQLDNPVLCALRNLYLRFAPQSVLMRPFEDALKPHLAPLETSS
ncbi:FAD-dependent monooxygenase [Streptomyces sp. NPDC058295]|uniref:FAD-dependent monooxygenase n=1 Tax=Streptomyces sp. NPDC058295 TaxID=3346431 RepID=UPI0036E1C192